MVEATKLLVSFLVGSGVIALIFREAISDWFQRRRVDWRARKKLAKQIHAILSEGDSCTYRKKPEDPRHIFFVANQLEAFHPEMAATLRSYLGIWSLLATFEKATPNVPTYEKENTKYVIELQGQAKNYSDFLLKEASKW